MTRASIFAPILGIAICAILTMWHAYQHVFSFDIKGAMGGYIHGDILLLLIGLVLCGVLYIVSGRIPD